MLELAQPLEESVVRQSAGLESGLPHRLASSRPRFALYPGIQDYCDNPSKANFQHRSKQAGDVELSIAKRQRRLGIRAHDSCHERQNEVVGNRNIRPQMPSPSITAIRSRPIHLPASGVGAGGVLEVSSIDCVMQIVPQRINLGKAVE